MNREQLEIKAHELYPYLKLRTGPVDQENYKAANRMRINDWIAGAEYALSQSGGMKDFTNKQQYLTIEELTVLNETSRRTFSDRPTTLSASPSSSDKLQGLQDENGTLTAVNNEMRAEIDRLKGEHKEMLEMLKHILDTTFIAQYHVTVAQNVESLITKIESK